LIASKKQLPASFNDENIRNFYLIVKDNGEKISEKTAEFLLFLFKTNNMVAESIDLCTNYHQIVRGYETEQ
jgi:hypothetical protein